MTITSTKSWPPYVEYLFNEMAKDMQEPTESLREEILDSVYAFKYTLDIKPEDKLKYPALYAFSEIEFKPDTYSPNQLTYQLHKEVSYTNNTISYLPSTAIPLCRHPPTLIFTDTTNQRWHAASQANLFDAPFSLAERTLIISLTPQTLPVVIANFKTVLSEYTPYHITIPWSDYKPGNYGREFYLFLLKEVRANTKISDIIVHCVGGHGRTGTMLAIMEGLAIQTPNVIEKIRTSYCGKAVENKDQEKYVSAILQL